MGIDNTEMEKEDGFYDNASQSSGEGKKNPEGAESDKGSFDEQPGIREGPIGEESQSVKPPAPLAQDMGDRIDSSPGSSVNNGMEPDGPETLNEFDIELKMADNENKAHTNIAMEDEKEMETKF
jgi:hypothetical protein